MKLIINIDEETLQDLYDSRYVSPHIKDVFRSATPLPKGHGRLIDADKLTENILCQTFGLRSVDIEKAPTIIEADKGERINEVYMDSNDSYFLYYVDDIHDTRLSVLSKKV